MTRTIHTLVEHAIAVHAAANNTVPGAEGYTGPTAFSGHAQFSFANEQNAVETPYTIHVDSVSEGEDDEDDDEIEFVSEVIAGD